LAGRQGPLPADLRCARELRRPLSAARRLRALREGAGTGGCAVPQSADVESQGFVECRRNGAVLFGPHDLRLRARDLAGTAVEVLSQSVAGAAAVQIAVRLIRP